MLNGLKQRAMAAIAAKAEGLMTDGFKQLLAKSIVKLESYAAKTANKVDDAIVRTLREELGIHEWTEYKEEQNGGSTDTNGGTKE